MNIYDAISRVENVLKKAPGCSCGLIGQKRVFGIAKGPSGGLELLATLYLDDPFFGFWYGHVLKHPNKPSIFVALIAWTDKFINGDSVYLLFQRFHFWIKDRLEYHPCAVQHPDDAYKECCSFESAADALCQMIGRFGIDERSAFEGSKFENSPVETRVIEIYGLANIEDGQDLPERPVPMPVACEVKGGLP